MASFLLEIAWDFISGNAGALQHGFILLFTFYDGGKENSLFLLSNARKTTGSFLMHLEVVAKVILKSADNSKIKYRCLEYMALPTFQV